MTRVTRDLSGALEIIAREGRIARARCVAREHNPHRHLSADRYPVIGGAGIDAMVQAWWRGWDQTDGDLKE